MSADVMSLEDFQAAIRTEGVSIDAGAPSELPKEDSAKLDLLRPYFGKPMREVPRWVLLLFGMQDEKAVKGETAMKLVRALPLPERMASDSSDDFI
jgi:hypothetical protein